ncbi:MAG: aminoacyl-tRNA hydrolase [Spirochaetaceae bacterium]|nr:MAG: aminoacyl-tRNA hydrolase [Spirochaetaceae bacterium]
MIDVLVLLGNPGAQYHRTRHNVAWLLAERIEALRGATRQRKFLADYAAVGWGASRIHVLWPQTFMNRCGESVGRLCAFLRVDPRRVLVVHDELELPFGTIALRRGGGLGGHNGLKSLRSALATADFLRLRIGISRPGHGNVSAYVLSRFAPDQEAVLHQVLDAAARAVERCVQAADATQQEAVLRDYARVEVL